jgi:hypothetical protein
MGKILCGFYLLVGILCTVSLITSFAYGEYVLLTQWLFLAAIVNFVLFNIVWKEEKKRAKAKPSPVKI